MLKISKAQFNKKLTALKKVVQDIIREGHVLSEVNAEKLQKLRKEYSIKSHAFGNNELTREQSEALKNVRSQYPKVERSPLGKRVQQSLALKAKTEEKISKEYERRAKIDFEAGVLARKLFPEVREAAKKFLSATITNMNELFDSYKVKRAELQKALDNLSKEKRIEQLKKLINLSEQVNQYKLKLELDLRNMDKIIRVAVKQASEDVQSMTVEQLILAILPDASKEELLRILGAENLKLLQQGNKVSEITDGHGIGDLVLADLSGSEQSALVRVILQELAKTESGEQAGPLAQFVKAIEKDIAGLMSGEKTHLSMIYVIDGNIQSVHIDIRALLSRPEEFISTLVFTLAKQGVTAKDTVIMTLSSLTEAAALLQLQGIDVKLLTEDGTTLPEITGQLIQYANNPTAVKQIMRGQESDASLSSIFYDMYRTQPARGFNPEQILNFLQVIATMLRTRALLIRGPEKQEGLNPLLAGIQDTPLLGGIQYMQIQGPEHNKVLIPNVEDPKKLAIEQSPKKEEPVKIDDQVKLPPSLPKQQVILNRQAEKFIQLLGELRNLETILYKKAGNKPQDNNAPYTKAAKASSELIDVLDKERSIFFSNPTPEAFAAFKKNCETAIKSASSVLEQHRGWHKVHPVLKGILGVLAILTVLPALIVSIAAKDGYCGTFFATPATASAQKLKPVVDEMEVLNLDIAKSFR